MRRLIGPLLLLAGLAYPFAVYFGIDHLSPRSFALLLGGLWLARLLSRQSGSGGPWQAVAALLFCLVLALCDSPQLLRWYPVLMSALLLAVFGLSLRHGPPLIERLARLRTPELPPQAIPYTRRVTQVWCGFFVVNGLIAAALTLWAPLSWWTLYNGLIAYLLMGMLFAGEWLVRRHKMRESA